MPQTRDAAAEAGKDTMTPFHTEVTSSFHLCIQAWPVIHTECDAAAFGPGRNDSNSPTAGTESDPTARAAEAGIAARCAGAYAWMGEWGDWLLALRLWDRTNGPHIGRTIQWTPEAVTEWAQPAVNRLASQVDHTGGWQARQTVELVLCGRLVRLSNRASGYARRTPRKGETLGGITVGERTNLVERCAECDNPVFGTSEDPIRRIDGQPMHAKSCYYRAWRRRQTAQQGKAS
jgi:hypothetical protein